MIKPLYKSFLPYLLLLVIIVTTVFIFDSYAERISREPEVVYLGGGDNGTEYGSFSQLMENEFALEFEGNRVMDSAFSAAMDQFRSGNYREAEEMALSLQHRLPRSPDVRNLRGLIGVRLQHFSEAESCFREALDLDSTHQDARINLASLYMNMHRYGEAEVQYRHAGNRNPNNPSIPYNLGLLYMETDRLQEAMHAFRLSAELSSGIRRARALTQLGKVQLERFDTAEARRTLDEAILQDPRNEQARLHLALTFNDPTARENELLKIYSLNPSSFQANYYLARLYRARQELPRAELHFKKALEQQPYHMHVMDELGNLLIDQGRMEEARLVFSGFAVGDTLPQSYFYQAKIAVGIGSIGDAIRLYRLAISRSNNNYPEACLNMAILYNQLDSTQQAITSYRSAIEARPGYALAYFNLGVLYTDLDSTDLAIDSYLESIRIDPSLAKSWYNLGRLYDQQGETGLAINAFRKALETDQDYTKARLALANAFLRSEEYSGAVEQYRLLLDQHPNYAKAWFNLGLAYSRQERTEEAIGAYEKLIEVDPEHVRARINLAILYGRSDRITMAINLLEDAMDLEPDNPDIRFNLGLQHEKLGDHQSATYQFLRVIELDPGYRRAYEQLLMIYHQLGENVNYEILAFRQMKQFDGDDAFYDMGKRLQDVGEHQLALEAFQLALDRGDDRDWLLYWTGKAHLDLEEVEVAIAWFNQVLERDPLHKFSLYRMGQAYEMLGEPVRAESYYSSLLDLDQDFRIVHKEPI